MPAIYSAECWCDSCRAAIEKRILAESTEADRERFESGDEREWDSDEFPKYMSDEQESDCPQHCAAGEECLEFEELPSGRKIGALLSDCLTEEGQKYVREAQADGDEVADFWADRFGLSRLEQYGKRSEFKEFWQGYCEAMCFTATDFSDPDNTGEVWGGRGEWSANRDWQKCLEETGIDFDELREELAEWFADNLPLFCEANDYRDAGADCYFSRNGHGCGFFDSPEKWGEADALQKAAEALGRLELVKYAEDEFYLER